MGDNQVQAANATAKARSQGAHKPRRMLRKKRNERASFKDPPTPIVRGCESPSTRCAVRAVSSSVVTASRRSSSVAPGRHRVQIAHFFRMQIGSQTPSGIGLRSGSRLHRMRQCSGLSRELWIENLGGSWPTEMSGWESCHIYLSMEAPAHAA